MNIVILIPIILPFLFAIIGTKVLFKGEKIRNFYIITGVIINLISVIGILLIDGGMELHLLKINPFIDIYFRIDKLGILFALLASILWIFTTFYSLVYMDHEGNQERFFTFFILTLGVTIGIAFSGNLFTLYIFYELLTLATFPLVIHAGSKEALYSGRKYLIYSFGGATLALLGMILLFSMSNNLSFVEHGVLGISHIDNPNLLRIVYMVMFLGFGVKAAIVPFHSWLPAAMVAPTPVSSLLHAVAVVKSGIFALVRVCYFIFGSEVIKQINGNEYISILVFLTILLGSLLALHQDNLKKRLAYSTVSQLGYIVLGIILLNEDALVGGLLHLVNHAVIKITLFFCVGAIYFMTHKKNIDEIKGIGKQMPVTMWCFGIASISLIGIPPANGFVSKWYLALGGLSENKIIFPIILLVSAFLTAGYLLPIVVTAFFHKEEKKDFKNLDPPPKMLIPIVLLTGIVIFLGLFPNVILHYIQSIVRNIV
ncbi:monovalent cation/H+ antiporter subunit D family protein [Crassaminicella thermophila]|uniref:Monovalent cation/H+ antiporter subunit D family protein n=1 Tax=Crassaminicella thermophila TaxID=2599308 RepID=A0A5C0SGU6_CRATE|nr:monovalent cation/H+ antiporter subunit D family protein [Crassaminicella thermophila]QEK13420.1 monovalent cation/H+ antiporter subunit D family protein [Crassaminicella thermophila]